MNFFEAQERARKSSRLLVWWFILSVIGVIAVMYGFATVFWHFNTSSSEGVSAVTEVSVLKWWNPELLLWTSLLVGGVIVIGSLFKLSQLSAGGKVVAQNLGGRAIEPNTTDYLERRLLNVVEEMAIASGLPVPEVWVMDEESGINAFAAGTDPTNAVVGVTRGTLERLSRSEIQGVIAHEFSHILNGDMKLNMRLVGWIFGLVMLSMLGRLMLESLRFMRGSRDSKGGGGVVLALVVAGLVVWLVGSIGVLFARMLQAAISRQREYLADASAVQFTRDTGGISGALKKIGGFAEHGKISSPAAAEARHMFFAGSSLSSLMATHPPIDRRIKAIEPNWDGAMLNADRQVQNDGVEPGMMGFAGRVEPITESERTGLPGDSGQIDSHIGESRVRELSLSEENHLVSKDQAKALLLGLLVDSEHVQMEEIRLIFETYGWSDETRFRQVLDSSQQVVDKNSADKLALVDLALPWLRRMNSNEAMEFVSLSQALIAADGQVHLFEFMLQQVIRRNVEIGLGLVAVPRMRYRKLIELENEVSIVLAAFAQVSGGDDVLKRANSEYREHTGRDLTFDPVAGLGAVAAALEKMDASSPLVKAQILRLCSLVVMDDGKVLDAEIELLRATAEAMGAPIPPMVRRAS